METRRGDEAAAKRRRWLTGWRAIIERAGLVSGRSVTASLRGETDKLPLADEATTPQILPPLPTSAS